jgi:hypothetical protein
MSSIRRKSCSDTREDAARGVTNEHPKSKTMKNEFLIWALVSVNLVACSSEGDILPKKERFVRPDAALVDDVAPDVAGDGRKPRDPNANCVKPGTPNNERGMGGYCEPGRGDCETEQGPRFCTADYAELTPIDDDKWFCSTVCMTNEECGTGAVCTRGSIGNGCTPLTCAPDASTPDQ